MRRSRSECARERQSALKDMCPCHLRADIGELWERIFELTRDPIGPVRMQALHALGDGSPRRLEERVVEAAENMYNDPDAKVKKMARRLVVAYRATGKWNVL